FLRSAVAWERTGATLSAPFAGVHIVEATKQVYRAIPARRERRRLVPALEPVLVPSAPGAARTGEPLSSGRWLRGGVVVSRGPRRRVRGRGRGGGVGGR